MPTDGEDEHASGREGASLSTPAPDRHPIIMPEPFDGKVGEWTAWIEQFELAAEINKWKSDQPGRSAAIYHQI